MKPDEFYRTTTGPLFRLLKTPTEPPGTPAGSHDSVVVMRASPKFLKYRLVLLALGSVASFLFFLLFIIITAITGDQAGLIICILFLPVVAIGTVIGYIAVRIDYALRYYVLTDRSLRVRSGAFTVRELTLTYANVQNLSLHQGPIQRWLGISDLRLDTAGGGASSKEGKKGGGAHGASIAGVENAREIREQIRELMRTHGGGAGLGDPDDVQARRRASTIGAATLAVLREVAVEARALRVAAEPRGE